MHRRAYLREGTVAHWQSHEIRSQPRPSSAASQRVARQKAVAGRTLTDVHERLIHRTTGGVAGERQILHHAVLIEARSDTRFQLACTGCRFAASGVTKCADALEVNLMEERCAKSGVARVPIHLVDDEENVTRLDFDHTAQMSLTS